MMFMSYVNDSEQEAQQLTLKISRLVFCPTMTCGTLEMCQQSQWGIESFQTSLNCSSIFSSFIALEVLGLTTNNQNTRKHQDSICQNYVVGDLKPFQSLSRDEVGKTETERVHRGDYSTETLSQAKGTFTKQAKIDRFGGGLYFSCSTMTPCFKPSWGQYIMEGMAMLWYSFVNMGAGLVAFPPRLSYPQMGP